MKCYKFLLTLILTSLNINSYLYAWAIPEDITFMGLEKLSSEVKKTVFSIQIKNDDGNFAPIGTGFLLKQGDLVVGITCAHVVENKKDIFVGLNTSKGFKRFRGRVARIDSNDIAVLVFEKDTEENIMIENLILDPNYLSGEPKFAEGRAILIPGYPLGIGAKYNQNNPVIRFGIVAQCSGNKTFLIDGVANPGNSGSPVFDTKEIKFIGMITSYIPDSINLYDQDGRHIAQLPYNSGLSMAISSTVITNVLKELEKEIKSSGKPIPKKN
jgi:S1-C subfamily serine protease